MKVAYNSCFGVFCLSDKAEKLYRELGGTNEPIGKCRHDPILIQVIEKLGDEASCRPRSRIRLHDIKGNKYVMIRNDGFEIVIEPSDIKWIEVTNDCR